MLGSLVPIAKKRLTAVSTLLSTSASDLPPSSTNRLGLPLVSPGGGSLEEVSPPVGSTEPEEVGSDAEFALSSVGADGVERSVSEVESGPGVLGSNVDELDGSVVDDVGPVELEPFVVGVVVLCVLVEEGPVVGAVVVLLPKGPGGFSLDVVPHAVKISAAEVRSAP